MPGQGIILKRQKSPISYLPSDMAPIPQWAFTLALSVPLGCTENE